MLSYCLSPAFWFDSMGENRVLTSWCFGGPNILCVTAQGTNWMQFGPGPYKPFSHRLVLGAD